MADENQSPEVEAAQADSPESYSNVEAFDTPVKKEEKKDERMGLPPSVRVETVNAPTQLQPGDPNAQGPWIQYNGIGTVRVLTPEDWSAAGIESDKYVEWNYLNHKRVPVAAFSDQELQYLLRCDGRFSLVEDSPEK